MATGQNGGATLRLVIDLPPGGSPERAELMRTPLHTLLTGEAVEWRMTTADAIGDLPTAELIDAARSAASELDGTRATAAERRIAAMLGELADRLKGASERLARSQQEASAILWRVEPRKGTPHEGRLSKADTVALRKVAGWEG